MQAPAPVVTIVDPRSPALPLPDPARPQRAGLPRREQVLLAAVLLLLVAGLSSTRSVREHTRLSSLEVTARFGGGLVNEGAGVGGRLRLDVGGAGVDVTGVRLDNGWRALGEPVVSAADPSKSLLLITHDVDCRSDVRPPSSVTVTATSRNGGSRDLVVPVPTGRPVVQEARLLCGDVDLADAVVLLRSIVVRSPDGPTQLELRLVNRSTSPVTVLSASYSGLGALGSRSVPLTLPGRAPGLLDISRLTEHRLRLTSNLRQVDCDVSHVALDGGQRDSPPDLLDVLLQGADGQAVTRLDVQGLHAYLKADQVAACP